MLRQRPAGLVLCPDGVEPHTKHVHVLHRRPGGHAHTTARAALDIDIILGLLGLCGVLSRARTTSVIAVATDH